MEVSAKVLKVLLEKGGYVSGSELAAELGISKPTLHRIIEYLKRLGYVIESHPRKGYRLVLTDDLAEAGTYLRDLSTKLRYSIHYIKSCISTQDIAEALAREGATEGTVVIAESMTSGRGRLGRSWHAGQGGLWLTILLRPPALMNLQLLSLCAGVAVARAVNDLYGVGARLKWPNDVVVNDRKLCGILIEGRAEADKVHYVLVGIGINVNNELPEDLRTTAVTLRDLVGYPIPRIPLLKAVLRNFDYSYNLLLGGKHTEVIEMWKKLSNTLGRYVKVIAPDKIIEGYATDVTSDGALVIETAEGERKIVYSGDVIHLRF